MASFSDDRTPEISSSIERPRFRHPDIPIDEIDVQEFIGAGRFGCVFKGTWTTSLDEQNECSNSKQILTVALKKVLKLEKEVDILSQIRHRNIIRFYGVSIKVQEAKSPAIKAESPAISEFYIVTELAEYGSLYDYLHNKSAEMSIERTLEWAIQIAHGLRYLHYEALTTIIHRDLKSRNVVIGQNMTCKLCDFGISKDLTHSRTVPTTLAGTLAWMSPETITESKEGVTIATDVWSYAVLLWELFSRKIPYDGLEDCNTMWIIAQNGGRLAIPENCPFLANLFEKCWKITPQDRPGMREVVACLEHIKGDENVQRECAHFVENKEKWLSKIENQLKEFQKMKLDLAKWKEELDLREQDLKKRENSPKIFRTTIDTMGNPLDWDYDMVCSWVEHLADEADKTGIAEIKQEIIDKIICAVVTYEINGSRLLEIGEIHLVRLGIADKTARRYFLEKIDGLRARCDTTSDL